MLHYHSSEENNNELAKTGFDNVVFGLYGTLIDIRTDENDPMLWKALSDFCAGQGVRFSARKLKETFDSEVSRQRSRVHALHPGRLNIDIDLMNVFEGIYRSADVGADRYLLEDTARFFRERSTKMIRLYSGVEELLEMLADSGKKLFILANAQSCFAVPEMRLLGIDDLFDNVYLSSDHLVRKPDSEFYDIMIKGSDLDPSRTILIGNDREADIAAAHDKGLRCIYLHNELSPVSTGPIRAEFAVMNGDIGEITAYLEELL